MPVAGWRFPDEHVQVASATSKCVSGSLSAGVSAWTSTTAPSASCTAARDVDVGAGPVDQVALFPVHTFPDSLSTLSTATSSVGDPIVGCIALHAQRFDAAVAGALPTEGCLGNVARQRSPMRSSLESSCHRNMIHKGDLKFIVAHP